MCTLILTFLSLVSGRILFESLALSGSVFYDSLPIKLVLWLPLVGLLFTIIPMVHSKLMFCPVYKNASFCSLLDNFVQYYQRSIHVLFVSFSLICTSVGYTKYTRGYTGLLNKSVGTDSVLDSSIFDAYTLHDVLYAFDNYGPIEVLGFEMNEFIFFFVLLNAFVTFCCIFFVCSNQSYISITDVLSRCQLLYITQIFANFAFTANDLLGFYIFYEAIIIPVFLLIGIWGSTQRRKKAAYFFFFFTLISSLPMLIAIFIIKSRLNTTGLATLLEFANLFEPDIQRVVWFLLFISFAFKVPMFPAHIWLPEAHVEAPTEGSMLLAGLLLKLGFFGFYRFLLTLFVEGRDFFSPYLAMVALISLITASLTALRQVDIKRIIAYSSIVHMNFSMLSYFGLTQAGLFGAFISMFSHAIISTILFALIGTLYSRTGTRLLNYSSGLVLVMPKYCIFFFLFSFFNCAPPGTVAFVAEFIMYAGISKISFLLSFLTLFSFFLTMAYMMWSVARICFGDLNTNYTAKYADLTFSEFFFYFGMALVVLYIGIHPDFLGLGLLKTYIKV